MNVHCSSLRLNNHQNLAQIHLVLSLAEAKFQVGLNQIPDVMMFCHCIPYFTSLKYIDLFSHRHIIITLKLNNNSLT